MNREQLKQLEDDLWSAADNFRANFDLKASEYGTAANFNLNSQLQLPQSGLFHFPLFLSRASIHATLGVTFRGPATWQWKSQGAQMMLNFGSASQCAI